jgi:hypothetical protein
MLRVTNEPTFTHDCTVQVPVDGGFREDKCKATFKVLPTDEVDKFDLATEKGTKEFLLAALVRIDELEGENKQPVSYNDEIRDQLLRVPYVRLALARTYFDAVGKARLGN